MKATSPPAIAATIAGPRGCERRRRKAAAYAYRGHWKSVRNADQKRAIQNIENDEWRHRKLVGEMLLGLDAGPSKRREIRAALIRSHSRFTLLLYRLARANVRRGKA